MAMKENEFYAVGLKKRIIIPKEKIREVIRNGRTFKVGLYKSAKGKEVEAWKVVGKK